MRVTEDRTPSIPPSGPRGRRKKKKPRAFGLATPPRAPVNPIQFYVGLPRAGLYALLVLLPVVIAYTLIRRAPIEEDLTFARQPLVRTGTVSGDAEGGDDVRAAERRKIEAVFGDTLSDVKDATDFDESPAWRAALEIMANQDPKFVTDNLKFSLNLHYDEVMKNPAAYRGQFVRMRGMAGHFRAHKLDAPIAGRTDFYRGLIADPGDTERVIFDLLDPPPPFRQMYEPVDVDAVLFRTVKYQSQGGNTVELPWIIGRTVAVKSTTQAGISLARAITAIVGFLALLFVIVYLFRRGKSPLGSTRGRTTKNAGFRDMFQRKLDEERRQGPPPPTAPD